MTIDDDSPAPVPDWILTFGDMMSLLLTFFIMLVSMSEMKSQEKFNAMADSMRQQFGLDVTSTNLVPGWAKPRDSKLSKVVAAGRARKAEAVPGERLFRPIASEQESFRIVRAGNQIDMRGAVYFSDSSAALTDQAKQDLQVIAFDISGKSHKIEIRGHCAAQSTADRAVFADQWRLANERSLNTMHFLVDQLKIDPRRVRISAAAANEPIHVGSDPTKLRQNDRVDIYLLDEIVVDISATAVERKRRSTDGERL